MVHKFLDSTRISRFSHKLQKAINEDLSLLGMVPCILVVFRIKMQEFTVTPVLKENCIQKIDFGGKLLTLWKFKLQVPVLNGIFMQRKEKKKVAYGSVVWRIHCILSNQSLRMFQITRIPKVFRRWLPRNLQCLHIIYALFRVGFALLMETAVAQWLRCCAPNRKVAGSIPDVVFGIFHWHNPSDRTMALGSTQSLTEMSTRRISWR